MRNAQKYLVYKSLTLITVCVLGTLLHSPALAQIEPGRFLYTTDNGIVLQPASRVADDITDISWSPDSSRLVTFSLHIRPIDAGESEATSEFTVTRWVRGTHSASSLYSVRIPGTTDLMYPCAWLPTTDIAIADMGWDEPLPPTVVNGVPQKQVTPHHILLWIDVRRGAVKQIEVNSHELFFVSPGRPVAVLMYVVRFGEIAKPMFTTIRPDGSLGKSFELATNQRVKSPDWSEDGRRLNFRLATLDETKSKVISSVPSYYDPTTGEIGTVTIAPTQTPHPPKPSVLQISQPVRQMTEVETSAKVRPLWVSATIKSEHPRLMACADADLGVLSPDGSAIAYRSSGSAWVSELKSIPLVQFKQMLVQAQRAAAMQNGKEVALAIIMYTQDNNEVIPGPNQNVDLSKYMTDPTALSEFNQVYAGGPLADVASPADTILGTINGPGGIVDVYIDGHVKWRNQ